MRCLLAACLLAAAHGWQPALRPAGLTAARRPPPPRAAAVAVDVKGLRKEAERTLSRAYKKLSKATERAEACEARQEELLTSPDAPLADLEALPNCAALRANADAEASRLGQLEALVGGLQYEADDATRLAELIALAAELGVDDKPPARPPRKPKKKGPRPSTAPRVPYRVYGSEDGAEIRVGRTASDNDLLSCDPEHRDGSDWWLHAAGCPGSHVIVRADSVGGEALPREVELDAAALAAHFSKASESVVFVNLCRARQVSKPNGAKPGLVRLSGDVRTVRVDWRKERKRLERLGVPSES